jgi:hypothetical protein
MSDPTTSPSPPPAGPPPEEERLAFGKIVAVGIGAILLFAAAVAFTRQMLHVETRAALPHGEAPAPRVGQDEIGIVDQKMFELEGRAARLRREQLQRRDSYGWVDRDAGIIHIPIQRAMDETVQELSRGGDQP